MKCFYELAAMKPAGIDARTRDGRPASQVQMAFRAPSIAAAIRLRNTFGWNRRYVEQYVQVSDDIPPGVPLADYEPGTILVAPLDPGDTIDDTGGWRPLGVSG